MLSIVVHQAYSRRVTFAVQQGGAPKLQLEHEMSLTLGQAAGAHALLRSNPITVTVP
jgi:hypothetical protein